jgi:hypothetical protein
MTWQYFIHGTSTNPLAILQSKKLSFQKNRHDTDLPNMVYCTYIYKGIQHHCSKPAWNAMNNPSFIFVFDCKLAKDLEMYICDDVAYGSCMTDKQFRVQHTRGKLTRIPSFSKIRKHITRRIDETNSRNSTRRCTDTRAFAMSHEVLFHEIPINYIKAIFVRRDRRKTDDKLTQLKQYIIENNLDIQIIRYGKTVGNYEKYFDQL